MTLRHSIRATGDSVPPLHRPVAVSVASRPRVRVYPSFFDVQPRVKPVPVRPRRFSVETNKQQPPPQTSSAPSPPVSAAAAGSSPPRSVADQGSDPSFERTQHGMASAAPIQSPPNPPSSAVATTANPGLAAEEDEEAALASASMSAFARMEAQMRLRQKQRERAEAIEKAKNQAAAARTAAGPPVAAASATVAAAAVIAPVSTSWRVEPESLELHPPPEPGPGMCCGRDCPNCVWIQYSEALAQYEEGRAARAERAERDAKESRASLALDASSSPDAAAAVPLGRELTRFERTMLREKEAARKK